MKTLFLIRGLPGSGKTTLSESFVGKNYHYEADMYFYDDEGNYNFDVTKLDRAHEWCRNNVDHIMSFGRSDVLVSNTFTTEKELKPYLELAKEYNYRVVSLVVENRHNGKSIHNVPEVTMEKMEKRFSVKLR